MRKEQKKIDRQTTTTRAIACVWVTKHFHDGVNMEKKTLETYSIGCCRLTKKRFRLLLQTVTCGILKNAITSIGQMIYNPLGISFFFNHKMLVGFWVLDEGPCSQGSFRESRFHFKVIDCCVRWQLTEKTNLKSLSNSVERIIGIISLFLPAMNPFINLFNCYRVRRRFIAPNALDAYHTCLCRPSFCCPWLISSYRQDV